MELDVQDWLIVIGALLIVGVLLDAWRRLRNDRRNPLKWGSGKFGPGDGFRESPEPAGAELMGGARVIPRDESEPPAAPRGKSGRVEPRFEPAATEASAAPRPAPRPAPVVPTPPPAVAAKPRTPNGQPPAAGTEEVVQIRVLARGADGFAGTDLMRIFQECDVRFGDMRIFHRHEEEKGQGAVQFSVVNVVEPGTFDAEAMQSFSTPGLGFFMRLPGPHKPLEAFDCMLETARAIARYLNGELRDESNSVFTQQTGEHCRQRIREFALRKQARR